MWGLQISGFQELVEEYHSVGGYSLKYIYKHSATARRHILYS
jgi:hypothetical protein